MEMLIEYLKVFVTGGIICAIGQILIDKTKLTPARILVMFVTLGAILTAIGVYGPIVEFGKAGEQYLYVDLDIRLQLEP